MQSLVAYYPTLEHEYASFLFSIDDLRHPLLQDLPFCERAEQHADFDFSHDQFLEHRVVWIERELLLNSVFVLSDSQRKVFAVV